MNVYLIAIPLVVEKSISRNAKIVIPSGSELINVIGEMAGVLPLGRGAQEGRPS
ncbi:MAG: hypothetical protein PHU25_14560 [Deltaproteobacteria bacterium]|nr:hypothetical protein [Deltaproteobacteria bacterium]